MKNNNNGADIATLLQAKLAKEKKEEAQKKEQEIFSKVINIFLKKNKFHSGALAMGLGGLIIFSSVLSLISFWIPFVCGICIIANANLRFLMGCKTDLSEIEKNVLSLIELKTALAELNEDGSN